MSFAPGSQFGAYEILDQVGRGGMATVYRAYQASLDRYVAIKVLAAFFADEEGFRERFRREAVAVAQLRHPNILTIFDYGEEGGVAYLVSEFVDGGTLASQLGEPLPVDRVRQVLGPIAAALDYAHARGIVHRDVKPSNILLAHDGTPVLADFGLSVMMGSLPRLTRTGTLTGTPEYMAPEHAAGEPTGPAGDQYALAVVAYEMLTGRVPFTAETPLAVLLAHLHRPAPSLRDVHPDLNVSVALEGALLKGLAKAPGDRFASASDFMAAFTDPAPAATRRQKRAPTGRRAAALAVSGAALVVVLGLAAFIFLRPAAQVASSPGPSPAVADELVLADSLANPSSAAFTREQSGSSLASFSNGDSATYPWDFAYMFSAIVAHVLGPYPANPDGAWLAASTTLNQALPRDFAVQVRGRVTRSPDASAFGLGFQSNPDQQYQFYVTPADQGFRLEVAQAPAAAAAGRSAWILPASQPNLVRLEIRGDTLRILVNGHELAREAPPGLTVRQGGSVSLRWAMTAPPSEGGSVEVRFAQFALYKLT